MLGLTYLNKLEWSKLKFSLNWRSPMTENKGLKALQCPSLIWTSWGFPILLIGLYQYSGTTYPDTKKVLSNPLHFNQLNFSVPPCPAHPSHHPQWRSCLKTPPAAFLHQSAGYQSSAAVRDNLSLLWSIVRSQISTICYWHFGFKLKIRNLF